ncbi:hypothetical protein lbkm_0015 [Lachnospiraceae bacterium KM106-2]|nr:hypothetical protein lbkm_0015 [Lachnospiraceae bacterium KM106-2]
MRQKLTRRSLMLVIALMIAITAQFAVTEQISAKTTTKNVVIAKINGNTMEYHKSISATRLIKNADWENIVGYGKKYKIKLASNAKFYVLDSYTFKTKKVSKKRFMQNVKAFGYQKSKDKGVTYYWGMACKLTIKNGKCIKIVQRYQA